MRRNLSLLLLAFLSISAPAGTVWYVDSSTGSDVTGDGSSGNPWATVQHAIGDPGVQNGDELYLSGIFDENPVITKEVTLFGGTFAFSTMGSAPPWNYGLRIDADNVVLYNVWFQVDPSNVQGGALVLASRGGTTPIVGLTLDTCYFDTRALHTVLVADTFTAMVVERPRGCFLYETDANVDLTPTISTPYDEDDGFLFIGGQANGTVRNRIVHSVFDSYAPYPYFAGFGLCIRPASDETAEAYDIIAPLAHFGLGQGLLLDDSSAATTHGIRDIVIGDGGLGAALYSNDVDIEIVGLGGDTGEGISNVLISGFTTMGLSTNTSVLISQEGVGTSSIDFNTVLLRNNWIDVAPLTGYGVQNFATGGSVDARYNYWDDASGPTDDAGVILGSGTRISTGVDAIPWLRSASLQSRFITLPGGADTLDFSSTPPARVDLDLNAGVTGFASAALNTGVPWQGFFGMVGNVGVSRTINVDSTIPDGSFLALIVLGYDDTFVNTVLQGNESDVIIFSWDDLASMWVPAVEGNTAGTAQWEGDSPVPTTPLSPSDLGRYGVDTATNQAWAVVDHFTEFGAGESLAGMSVPAELSVFSAQ
jgi:hypothetical protein